MTDWNLWLRRYENPNSAHNRRLKTVQRLLTRQLERLAPGPVRVLSICAGDGRDILQVLDGRADAGRVSATLIEREAGLCALAREEIARQGLSNIEVREADAGLSDTYVDLPRADVVILVGVFGNMVDADARALIDALPSLCRRQARVIWSLRQQPRRGEAGAKDAARGTERQNDRARVERLDACFRAAGFTEAFANAPEAAFHVAAWRYGGMPKPLVPGQHIFSFVGPEDGPADEGAD